MASWPDGTDLQPAVAVLGDLGGVVPLDSLDHHPGRGVAWEDPARREIFPFGRERLAVTPGPDLRVRASEAVHDPG
jgi:hypothetical protein